MNVKKLVRLVSLFALILSSAALSGCFRQPWFDVYGYHCGNGHPSPGCDFYADGSKIVAVDDPYYNHYTYSNDVTWGYHSYTDVYGYDNSYWGWGWKSPDGILYDDYGRALNADENQSGRDLIANAAAIEEATIRDAGKRFAAKHALAETVGVSIARTLNQMATLPKRLNRARSSQDLRDFTKRLYGVDLDRLQSATEKAQAGDSSALKAVNADIAKSWGTQPETSEAILRGWYGEMLSGN